MSFKTLKIFDGQVIRLDNNDVIQVVKRIGSGTYGEVY